MNAGKGSVCSNGACVPAGERNQAEEGSPGSSWLGMSSNPQVLLTEQAAAPVLDGHRQPYGNASASAGEE